MLCYIAYFISSIIMKYQQRLLAQQLRQEGKSYTDILRQVKVSKGTLSLWLRDIILTEAQKKHLYITRRQQHIYDLAKKKQLEKEVRKNNTINEAKKEMSNFLPSPLFLSGVMLYWAEGDKAGQAEAIKFSNSDPLMIALMMRWFREVCHVPEQKFRIALHIHELHNEEEIKKYWSEITKIPLHQFHKTQIKPTSLGHRRKYLYKGTCSIRLGDSTLLRKIYGWRLGIMEQILPNQYKSLILQRGEQKPATMGP